jgi:hypothetical protein
MRANRFRFATWIIDSLWHRASLAIPLALAAKSINVPMLNFIADSLSRLPSPDSTDLDLLAARHRDKAILYELLLRLSSRTARSGSSHSAGRRRDQHGHRQLSTHS